MTYAFDKVLENVRKGRPTLVFDSKGREGETDIVVPSQFVTPEIVKIMRREGGGLICTTLKYEDAKKLGLGYITDIYSGSGIKVFEYLKPDDIPYDEKSAFSITINHRKTFTGIPDRDRSLTIKEFAKLLGRVHGLSGNLAVKEFGKWFRAPGHVHLLIARGGLLGERQGHTELSTALMVMSGVTPSATIVEMLDDNGYSLGYEKAKKYATDHGYEFVEGKQIKRWWGAISRKRGAH